MSTPTKPEAYENPFPHTRSPEAVRDEFAGVVLTDAGIAANQEIGMAFSDCLNRVEAVLVGAYAEHVPQHNQVNQQAKR